MKKQTIDVAVIGASIAGISVAYYLCQSSAIKTVALVDVGQSMAFTSAQSGENYRNWWPHQTMTRFTDYSIDLMEKIARDSNNRLHLTRRGYVLATRATHTDPLINDLYRGYGQHDKDKANCLIRIHSSNDHSRYQPSLSADWETAPEGVDVLQNRSLIHKFFPHYDETVTTLIHIRRAGDISSQQMGQYMLEQAKEQGLQRLSGKVVAIKKAQDFILTINSNDHTQTLHAERLVNAAGPFVNEIASMLDIQLPVQNILQQKIAFPDSKNAIPRQMPFSIDLDQQLIDWSKEEYSLLAADEESAWLINTMPGGIHCRPDGGDKGTWIKLGWAYNNTPIQANWNPSLDKHFPEIVLRGAARLNPALKIYYDQLPSRLSHYGGYYTMTEENWPLIGPIGVTNAYVIGTLSGFGTMTACGAGALCAAMMAGTYLPDYANDLGLSRYDNVDLMTQLANLSSRGIL